MSKNYLPVQLIIVIYFFTLKRLQEMRLNPLCKVSPNAYNPPYL